MTPSADLRIRAAGAEDVPTIRAIALDTWPDAYGRILSPEQLVYMLDRMYSTAALHEQLKLGHSFLLLEQAGKALGFAGAETHYAGTPHTRLHKLYVLPAEQGSGVGKALLNAVEQLAQSKGNSAVELNVNKYNPAQEFYRKLGYERIREEVIDIGNGFVMDDYVLQKPV